MRFRLPTFRSPVARALVPVVGGIIFFAALFGVTWLFAELATDQAGEQRSPQFGTFVVGNVEDIAESIVESGPVLYPDLRDATGERSIIIDIRGTGEKAEASIRFRLVGTKHLSLSWAPLKKV